MSHFTYLSTDSSHHVWAENPAVRLLGTDELLVSEMVLTHGVPLTYGVRVMAFVDLGQAIDFFTLDPNYLVTVTFSAGKEFRPGQWFRAAPWLDSDNSPGTSIVIGDSGTANGRSGEAVSIDQNGNVVVGLTLVNVGQDTASIGIEWLSAPELGE